MLILISIITFAGAAVALYTIFQKSERDEAQPVEPPTREDKQKGNVSPDVPVVDE